MVGLYILGPHHTPTDLYHAIGTHSAHPRLFPALLHLLIHHLTFLHHSLLHPSLHLSLAPLCLLPHPLCYCSQATCIWNVLYTHTAAATIIITATHHVVSMLMTSCLCTDILHSRFHLSTSRYTYNWYHHLLIFCNLYTMVWYLSIYSSYIDLTFSAIFNLPAKVHTWSTWSCLLDGSQMFFRGLPVS